MTEIGIIGAGAWGTALAHLVALQGRDVRLWALEDGVAAAINTRHENTAFLPGIALSHRIGATTALEDVASCPVLLLVTPAQHARDILKRARPHVTPDPVIVICAKGIERKTGLLLTDVVAAEVPGARVAVLSGPTFADEVAQGLPTAVTLATADAEVGPMLLDILGSRIFRPYLSDDPRGAEVGGAIKNVLAIAAGIVMGRGLGENARAALLTRGLAEMRRLTLAVGGRAETAMGLSGLGDLALTCMSPRSRNYSLGVDIGRGRKPADILAERNTVAEGVTTAAAVADLANRLGLDMPICHSVDAIVNHGAKVEATVADILSRRFRDETDGAPTTLV